MEILYAITFLLLPISLLLLIFHSYVIRPHNKNLPPGKTGWPLIGETLEFVLWGRKGSPDKFFSERTERYASRIFKTSLIGERMSVLCGAEGNKFLFSTESGRVALWFPSAFEKIFFSKADEKERCNEQSLRRRRLMAGFVRPEALKKYGGRVDGVAMKLMEDISASQQLHGHVTFNPLAKRYTFDVACMLFLSIDDSEHITKIYKHFGVIAAGLLSIPINFPGFPLNRAVKATKIIRKEILDIIKKRKIELSSSSSSPTSSNEKNDILFHMITTRDDNGRSMDEIEIVDTILGMLIAGYETASTVCACIINYMADLPEVYENVYKEQMEIARSKQEGEVLRWEETQKMSYSWSVACEAMRLTPPAPIGFRESLADLTFDGCAIPKGFKLVWSANTTHEDPQYFPEPEKFDPTRFQGKKIVPYSYVPFGGGPRKCPGGEYARLEILMLMHNMVKSFRWEKMIPNEKITFDPAPMPENGLPLRFYTH